MIEIIGEVGRPATEEEIKEFLNREVDTHDRENLQTCIDNDCGLCDQKGILVEDDDSCEKHRSGDRTSWKDAMMRTFLAGH